MTDIASHDGSPSTREANIDTAPLGSKVFTVGVTDLADDEFGITVHYEVVPELSLGVLVAVGVMLVASWRPRSGD